MKQLLQEEEDVLQKLGTVDQAMKRYQMGKKAMRETGDKARAIVRIGQKIRYNFTILDQYMDSLSGGYWDGV